MSVSNFPTTQPVSGSVSVSNFPTTQPVSGSVTIGNFPTTQGVSGTVGLDPAHNTVLSGDLTSGPPAQVTHTNAANTGGEYFVLGGGIDTSAYRTIRITVVCTSTSNDCGQDQVNVWQFARDVTGVGVIDDIIDTGAFSGPGFSKVFSKVYEVPGNNIHVTVDNAPGDQTLSAVLVGRAN